MRVILTHDVPDLGKAGTTVEVKAGYGRNFLLPRKLAIPATAANVRSLDEINKQVEFRAKKARREAEKVKDAIEKLELKIDVLVGEEDKLYGSITSGDIAEQLAEQGVTVDKRVIQLEQPIKALGVYTVPIKVDKDVIANVKLWVQKKLQG